MAVTYATRATQCRILMACVFVALCYDALFAAYVKIRCENKKGDHIEIDGKSPAVFYHVATDAQMATCGNGYFILSVDIMVTIPLLLYAGLADYTHFKDPINTPAMKRRSVSAIFLSSIWSSCLAVSGCIWESQRQGQGRSMRLFMHWGEIGLAAGIFCLGTVAYCSGPEYHEYVDYVSDEGSDADSDESGSGSDSGSASGSGSGSEGSRKGSGKDKKKKPDVIAQLPPEEKESYQNMPPEEQKAFKKQKKQEAKQATKEAAVDSNTAGDPGAVGQVPIPPGAPGQVPVPPGALGQTEVPPGQAPVDPTDNATVPKGRGSKTDDDAVAAPDGAQQAENADRRKSGASKRSSKAGSVGGSKRGSRSGSLAGGQRRSRRSTISETPSGPPIGLLVVVGVVAFISVVLCSQAVGASMAVCLLIFFIAAIGIIVGGSAPAPRQPSIDEGKAEAVQFTLRLMNLDYSGQLSSDAALRGIVKGCIREAVTEVVASVPLRNQTNAVPLQAEHFAIELAEAVAGVPVGSVATDVTVKVSSPAADDAELRQLEASLAGSFAQLAQAVQQKINEQADIKALADGIVAASEVSAPCLAFAEAPLDVEAIAQQTQMSAIVGGNIFISLLAVLGLFQLIPLTLVLVMTLLTWVFILVAIAGSAVATGSTKAKAAVITLRIDNVDCTQLDASAEVLQAFTDALKMAIAAEAGHGIEAQHVEIALVAAGQSTKAVAVITPPPSTEEILYKVASALTSSSSTADSVAAALNGVEALSAVLQAPVSVGEVSTPQLKTTEDAQAELDKLASSRPDSQNNSDNDAVPQSPQNAGGSPAAAPANENPQSQRPSTVDIAEGKKKQPTPSAAPVAGQAVPPPTTKQ